MKQDERRRLQRDAKLESQEWDAENITPDEPDSTFKTLPVMVSDPPLKERRPPPWWRVPQQASLLVYRYGEPRTAGGTSMAHVNLWPPSTRHPGPHGTVHIGRCKHVQEQRAPRKVA